MKFSLPVWNGTKSEIFTKEIKSLELKKSSVNGVFFRKDKNFIKYENNYIHMTPLKSGKYIKHLRDNKVNFVISNSIKVGNCLEVGAGDGFNLKILKSKKYTICDPFIKPKNEKKIKFINQYYENTNFQEKFDTILMFSVLEHAYNFEKFLEKSKKNLKSNGHIFLSIPIIDEQFQNGDFNCLLHEHINYFSMEGIFNVFKKYKFRVKNFYVKNDNGFFCIVNEDKKLKLQLYSKIFNLKKVEQIFKKKIISFSKFLINNNKRRIVFYGANNGLNNLLYLANKKRKINYKNIFVVDSDSKKWNKRLSYFNKKIKSPKFIKNSDLVCVTALSFLNEINATLKKDNQIISLNNI